MDVLAQELENRICRKSGDYFPQFGENRLCLDFSALKRASYSTLYFFRNNNRRTNGPRIGVVVKVYSRTQNGDELSKNQFAALCSLWPIFGDSSVFGLPRPLDLFPDLPAVVMEEVSGGA